MKPTLEEIINYAESEAGTNYKKNHHTKSYNDTFNGIVKGAEWAISQMQLEMISIEDRLPENRQLVLAYYSLGYDVFRYKHGCFFAYLEKVEGVTHWMPLPPEPPTK